MTDLAATLPVPRPVVLVTGAAGFIGSRTTALLGEAGFQIVAVDDLSVGLPLPAASDWLTPVEADIRDRATMAALFAEHRPIALVHLAAVHHIPTCERRPELAMDVNVMGTQSLLDAAEASGTRAVVFASSGAVYDWTEGPLVEDVAPLRPHDVYSITKLSNEYQLAVWAKRTGAKVGVARLFNTIGSNDPNGHLIPDILDQIGTGTETATVRLGNTAPRRDYIYVEDVAAALVAILGGVADGLAFEVFNVCTGEELSVADLVALIGDIVGVEVAIEVDPARVRKVDRVQQLGDPGKMRERFGWTAAWTAREALERIVTDTRSPEAADLVRAA